MEEKAKQKKASKQGEKKRGRRLLAAGPRQNQK